MEEINSNPYWDTRFIQDWEVYSGPEQSRFFARLAIQHLPKWLITELKRESLTLADWGCAQGDGTDEWATYLDAQQITGIDFSSVAIEQATQRYPAINFITENWLSIDYAAQESYDIVFSSNVMEHFHRPYDVLRTLCKKAKKGVVLALPYREMSRHEEHFVTFLAENVPLALPNNFRLIWSQVVDCTKIDVTYWSGEQIILVYAKTKWIDNLRLTLHDCLLEHEDVISEKIRLNSILAERDRQIATLSLTHAGRERELQDNIHAVRNELLLSEQAWIENAGQQEARYAAERAGLQDRLDELQHLLLTTEREKTEQLQNHVERERELQENLIGVRNELLYSEQAWIGKTSQQEARYADERAGFQAKLDKLQHALLTTEREKTEQLQIHTEREHELQDNLLALRNELRNTEKAWIENAGQQEARYEAERTGLQARLDELQHSLLTTEREKTEQLQTHAERERELQDNLLAVRNELLHLEQAWIEKTGQQEAIYAAERTGLQARLDELQHSLLATEREKTEQLQAHADRERELQYNLLAVRNELLHSEKTWIDEIDQQEARYTFERAGMQARLDELHHSLLTTEREKTEQLQTHAERERELQENLLAVRNELLHSEKTWIDEIDQQEARYRFERARMQARLDELHHSLLTTEREKTEQLQTHAERERELQENLLALRNELLHLERAWIDKANQQEACYADERAGLQARLDELKHSLLVTERVKTEQLQTHIERERELQDNLLAMRNELSRSEQGWIDEFDQQEARYTSERVGLQARLDELQQSLQTTEREKTEQLQAYSEQTHITARAHTERERSINEQLLILDKAAQEWQLDAAAKQIEINAIINSRFWRLTAPLRKLMRWHSEVGSGLNQKTSTLKNTAVGVDTTFNCAQGLGNQQLKATAYNEKIPTMTMQFIPDEKKEIKNIEDLLELYGEPFVCEVYRILLGRDPDPEGLAYYLKRLRRGKSKIAILAQIKSSKEARSIKANLPGMNAAIRRYKWSQLPFIGWIKPSSKQMNNRLRAIENRLFELDYAYTNKYNAELESRIAEKELYIEDKEIYIAKLLQVINSNPIKEKSLTPLLSDEFVVITGVPFDDIGGGQRGAQLARCALNTGRKVIYIYIYPKFDFDLNRHVESEIDLFGLTHLSIDSITPSGLLDLISSHATILIEFPHPKILPYLHMAKIRGVKTVFELIDDWETSLGGDWFDLNIYKQIAASADVAVGTAKILVQRLVDLGRNDALYLPNAANEYIFDKYRTYIRPADFPVRGNRTALYFGSLYGEWFAWDYVIAAALQNPHLDIILIGDNPGKNDLPANVFFLGAKKIDELPSYLEYSDLAILPFVPGKISDAVSPIKVFEYLFAGKPVVSTRLPEILDYPGVFIADDTQHFAELCATVTANDELVKLNDRFISQNSWFHRLDKIIDRQASGMFKSTVSVIILIHNNRNIIGRCLETLISHSEHYLREIIVVDNASSDGGADFVENAFPSVRVLRNSVNGCSSGRNLGVSVAKGKYLAFFDSDQWFTCSIFFDEALSILERDASVGAISWGAGWFDHTRSDLGGMIADYCPNRAMNNSAIIDGYRSDIGYLATCGLFVPKSVFDATDGFDTFYDPTCFEDTDLSFQFKKLDLKVCFRDLTGIRHQPHQTTGANTQSASYTELFTRNAEYFKTKWASHPGFFVDYPGC